MAHHRPLGDPLSGISQYSFAPRKAQQELSPGGRKNMAAIGSMRKKLTGFSDEGDDDYGSAGMYFNPSMFPPHRPEKEPHLGSLYGTPSGMQSPGPHQSNFYGSGIPGSGLPPNVNSMQVPPSAPRGMSSAQFGRSLSHPGHTHSTTSLTGSVTTPGGPSIPSSLHNMPGSQGGNLSSQSASRGILSMGPRGVMGQMPPGHLGNQSGLNSLSKTSRAISIPSSLSSAGSSRSSPVLSIGMTPAPQAPQQPQMHQPRGFNLGGNTITSSVPGPMSSFGLTRSQSTSGVSQGMGGSGLPLFSGAFAPPGAPDSPKSLRHIFSGAGQGLSDASSGGSSGLDLSEFPALANRSRIESLSRVEGVARLESIGGVSAPPSSMASRPSYGVVSKPAEPPPDFSIHNEDFPALPGSNTFKSENQTESSTSQDPSKQVISTSSGVFPGTDLRGVSSYEQALKDVAKDSRFATGESKSSSSNTKQPPRGIQTSPSGMISNIPKGMVTDQFGMIGLLTFIRAAETEPNLVTLALGSDLTTLGLNLNSPESLYHTFGSPFADSPCRPHEIDYHVPSEYRINTFIRDKLAPIKLSRYSEDLLFYLYYTNGGDILQLAAAAELYARDWRYHKDERLWLTRAPGVEPQLKTSSYERGTYYFFDCSSWRKVAKEFHLEYDKLEDKPTLQHVSAQ
ncbi:CCR4-NOT transcription complex subunit 2 [Porites harrisoni]